jgi:uncharacterized protein involved in outer membrane biogenesis
MKTNNTQTAGTKRHRWRCRFGWITLALVGLLVAVYFVSTSNAFFQRIILPRIGRSLDATVTVSHASIRPFSQLILRDLKVQPRGEDAVLMARELRIRYTLMHLLRGRIHLDEATLNSPTIHVIRNADGTSNWDPILMTLSPGPGETPPRSTSPATPMQVDFKTLVVSNAALHYRQTESNGDTLLAEIPELNFRLTGVKNGQTARLTLAADFEISATSASQVSQLSGALESDFSAGLANGLMPSSTEGEAELAVRTATGAFADAAELTATLTAKLTATEVEQLALQFAKRGVPLGSMTVTGPFDLRQQEGRLRYEVNGLGSEVLSLAGGSYEVSFGETKLAALGDLELKNQGKLINAIGSVTGTNGSLTRGSQTSPKIDFQLDYNLSADLIATNATLHQLAFLATQNGNPLVRAALTHEMRFDRNKGGAAVPDSTLELLLTEVDLAQWQALTGPGIKGGVLNGKLGLTVQRAGKLVAFDLASQLAGLSAEYQSNRIDGLAVTLVTHGQVTDFTKVDLVDFGMQATRVGHPLISVKGSGKYNTVTQDADLRSELEASLVQISNLAIRDVSRDQSRSPIDAQLKLDASLHNQRLDLRQAQLSLTPTERALNQLQLTGQVDLSQAHAITGTLKLVAESMDLTSYYNLYAGQQVPVAAEAPLPDASPSPNVEPAAIELPLRRFGGRLEIGRFYLRELALTNLQAAVHIDGNTVKLNPVRLVFNGAPVNAKAHLNLGVPGYQYAVDLEARELPVAPLVNTFQPDRQGQMSGTVSLLAQAAGAGLTGPSLQKNLAGQFDLSTTNLNLKLVDVRNSLLKSVINVIVGLPDILRDPGGAFGSIVKNLSVSGEIGGGWVDELSRSPIEVVLFRGQVGQGRVDVSRALVQSPAFEVETQGPVTLAPILTNSTIDFPVAVALRHSLAKKIGQVTADTPTNANYVRLPDFLTMQGTLGEPKKKLSYPALGHMALKLGGGIAGGSGQAAAEQLSSQLDGLRHVFGAKDSTNGNSIKVPSPKEIVDGLLRQRAAPTTNEPPATNATARPVSLLDLRR